MARPRKVTVEDKKYEVKVPEPEVPELKARKIVVEGLPKAKQFIRWISRRNVTNLEEGYFSVSDVDAHVSSWIDQGYSLFNTHYLGENPEGYAVLYILVA